MYMAPKSTVCFIYCADLSKIIMTLQFQFIPGGRCCGLEVARDVDLELLGHPDGRQGQGGAGHAGAPGGEKDVAPTVHVLHRTG